MKQGWEIKSIGDVCKVIAGQSPEGKYYNKNGNGLPFYQGKKEYGDKYIGKPTTWTTKVTKEAEANDILMSVRAPVGPINFATQKICIGRGLAAIRPTTLIDKEFLYSFLLKHENEIVGNTGAVFNSINKAQIEAIKIPLPPLQEQQRIVAILDETFAVIAKAKSNAEQNLKNAKELFESYLQGVFATKGEGWEEKKLIEITDKIGSGATPRGGNASYKTEGISLVRSMNVHDFEFREKNLALIDDKQAKELNNVTLQQNDVLLNITGASVARCCIIPKEYLPARVNQHVSIIRAKKEVIDPIFLNLLLTSKFYKDQLLFTGEQGATRQAITKAQLEVFKIAFPKSILEQRSLMNKLEALSVETKKLEAIYQQKIRDLEELKKSVLQKAFSGELSVTNVIDQVKSAKVSTPRPTIKVIKINPTDLQAGIVAISLQRHQQKNRENTFHHVKAEKIVHLAQSILNLELDRNPCKDAAGPNDFPHAKKVESRAKKAGFYNVLKKENFYEYSPGAQFQKLIDKTYLALDEKSESLNKLIDFIVPMTTQQAEIFATVYAGWNNLLIDNKKITDEDIVTESRENWHQDKLKIDREKFFKAIKWMREKNVIPIGTGNKVFKKTPAKKN